MLKRATQKTSVGSWINIIRDFCRKTEEIKMLKDFFFVR